MSTASTTPAGGWYADPLDGSLLRWWTGSTWSEQTMPAASVPADATPSFTTAPPVLSAVPPLDEPYIPANSVFRMPEAGSGESYSPEWSSLPDIAQDIALNGVPVQLALTSANSEPPIPVSMDAFPMLKPTTLDVPDAKVPAWQVEAPLAKPIDQLFPVSGPPTVSANVFPATAASAAPVPPPAGQLFPGLVPTAAEPGASAPVELALAPEPAPVAAPVAAPVVAIAEPVLQPVAPEPVAAEPAVAEPVLAPQPLAPEPVAPAPVLPPQPIAPQAELYTGPPPVQLASDPVAVPDLQPFAASTPGASYVPLTPRPIPQPALLDVPAPPVNEPTGSAPTAAAGTAVVLGSTGVATPLPPAPTEYWPTQGTPPPGAAQAGPGNYVPFDPSSVHLQPVPMIPFSSRDPYNSASTARPGMRAYASAPVGPSGSTWTGGIAFMLLAPLLTAGAAFGWTQLATTGVIPTSSVLYLGIGNFVIALLALAAAQFDRNSLANRGYFDLASPFWVLLGPLIYLIVRATRLHGQGRGAPGAIGLWLLAVIGSAALLGFAGVTYLSAPSPDRVGQIQSSIQSQLAAKSVTATVSCPTVASLAPGSTFGCTIKTATASLPIQVTITDWNGDFSVTSASGAGIPS